MHHRPDDAGSRQHAVQSVSGWNKVRVHENYELKHFEENEIM